jgi:hypothetical protein
MNFLDGVVPRTAPLALAVLCLSISTPAAAAPAWHCDLVPGPPGVLRVAQGGSCRLAQDLLHRAVLRLSWQRGEPADRVTPGPLTLELAPGAEPTAVWDMIRADPDWRRSTHRETRPFLQLARLVELPPVGEILIQLTDGGFEHRRDVFLTARQEGGEVVVTGALAPVFRVSIGEIEIADSLSLDGGEALLLGRSSGGDDGEVWGSVWVGWLGPRGFEMLVEEPYAWSVLDRVGERQVRLELDAAALRIDILDGGHRPTAGSRIVDLRPLLARARGGTAFVAP